MDSVWSELAREAPSALAVILVVYLFLKAEKEREIRREQNAIDKAAEERAYNQQVNSLWANNIATLVGKQDATFNMISQMITSVSTQLRKHDAEDAARYEKIGITQDLIKMAREQKEHEEKN